MSIIKRAAAALSAAAMTLSLVIPVGVSAEGEITLTLHYEDFNGGSPLTVDAGDAFTAGNALSAVAFNHNENSLKYPEPSGGKAVVGWETSEGAAFDFSSSLSESVDLYPVLADTVEAGSIAITADESVMPAAGAAIPSDFTDKITVPDGFVVTGAGYDSTEASFADDSVYILSISLKPAEDKVFDYKYNVKDEAVFSVDGATVNGSRANVSWDTIVRGGDGITVSLPVTLGDPETASLSLHYNGHGAAEDKTLDIEKNSSSAPYLDQSSGELVPEDEGYAFVGWYTDPELTSFYSYGLSREVTEDTELYAKWAKVISEINFTVETPLCGEEVKDENGQEITGEFLRQQAGTVALYEMEGPTAEPIVLTNEPDVTADVEGIEPHSAWIETDVPNDQLQYDTQVDLFIGTIYGENDYTFVINVETDGNDDTPYFAKDLKITVNGVDAEDGNTVPSADSRSVDAGASGVMRFLAEPLGIHADSRVLNAKPSTKAGFVTDANVVYRDGTSFTVVGTITADHVWDSGVITKDPGCEEDGIMTFTCRSKDASYTDEIDPYGHKWLDWEVVKPATATEDGLEMRRCENDGEHTETRVIPATGETDSSDESGDSSSKKDSSSSEKSKDSGTAATTTTTTTGTGTAAGVNTDTQPPTGSSAAAPLAAAAAAAALAVVVVRRRK